MSPWKDLATAPENVSILVRGPFGISVAQFAQGQFWAMAGNEEAYTEEGDLFMLEGVTAWMPLPSQNIDDESRA